MNLKNCPPSPLVQLNTLCTGDSNNTNMYRVKYRKQKVALMGLCLIEIAKRREKTVNRLEWVKNWIKERNQFGHMNLLRELRLNEKNDFKNYLRMSSSTFDELLGLISPYISKQNTVMRDCISAEERLIATLRYLATGHSYSELKFSTGIAAQTLGYIIPNTCIAICKALRNYLKMPDTKEEWKDIAKSFKNRWQVINCGGVLDGKHIRIRPPAGSGALYYNYKNFYSTVLLAVVNYDYEFVYVDVGKQGRISDGGVFSATVFGQRLKNNTLNLPESTETEEELNFSFIGDEAFALGPNLLTPYSRSNLTHNKHIYNYRISRARNVVENIFGHLTSMFRVLHTPINISPEKINYVVFAVCHLHNFLRKRSPSYTNISTTFHKGSHSSNSSSQMDRREQRIKPSDVLIPLQDCSRNTSSASKLNRDKYMEYYNGSGQVPWQEDMIKAGRS